MECRCAALEATETQSEILSKPLRQASVVSPVERFRNPLPAGAGVVR